MYHVFKKNQSYIEEESKLRRIRIKATSNKNQSYVE